MITLNINGAANFQIPWTQGMNVQNALETAFNQNSAANFTFSLQYYGSYGYLVDMINETYDTFISKYQPFYFWELLVNGNVSQTGIDTTILNDGDVVEFLFTTYTSTTHPSSTLHAKYKARLIV